MNGGMRGEDGEVGDNGVEKGEGNGKGGEGVGGVVGRG